MKAGRLRRRLVVAILTAVVIGAITPLAGAQDEGFRCRQLWPGFELDTPRGLCTFVDETVFNGSTASLYIHEDVPTDDVPDDDATRLTRDAFTRSISEFTQYGPMPERIDVLIVNKLTPGEDANAGIDDNGTCQVTVKVATFRGHRYYKQVLAHELFHCFQYVQDTPHADEEDSDAGLWWFEGTAEYFANVVYPHYDFEWDYLYDLRDLEPGNALVDLTYEAWVFFQHMANRQGDAAVIDFMRTLPPGGGRNRQMRAAAAWPGMDALFQDFAQAYTSSSIIDNDGFAVPIHAVRATLGREVVRTDGEVLALDDVKPFEINRVLLEFVGGESFDLEPVLSPGVRLGARRVGDDFDWVTLPDPLETGRRRQTWRVVVTSIDVSAVDPVALEVVSTAP